MGVTISQISGGGGGGASLIHQASRTLTDPQIKALPNPVSGAVTIVPTPGSNRIIIFVLGWMTLTRVSVYSNIDVNDALIGLGATFNLVAPILNNGSIGELTKFLSTGGTFVHLQPVSDVRDATYGVVSTTQAVSGADEPVNIFASNSVDFGGGNAGNSLDVYVGFQVFDLSQNKCLTTAESGWNETTRTFT